MFVIVTLNHAMLCATQQPQPQQTENSKEQVVHQRCTDHKHAIRLITPHFQYNDNSSRFCRTASLPHSLLLMIARAMRISVIISPYLQLPDLFRYSQAEIKVYIFYGSLTPDLSCSLCIGCPSGRESCTKQHRC